MALTHTRQAEKAAQSESVSVSLWRDKKLHEFEMNTVALDGSGLDRVFLWAGALLQEPHRALAAQRGSAPEGVSEAQVASFLGDL